MAITQRPQRLTLEEFLALPDEDPTLELEPDGTVTEKVSPKGRHSVLQFALCERINSFARPRRLALAFPELRAIYGGAAYTPDASVFAWERIPRTPEGEVADVFEVATDVAIEIVSPDQRVTRLVRRCLWHVANGVERALLIDPADRSVLQFQAGQPPRAPDMDEPIDFGTLLPDFRLSVRELFEALRLDK